jgi:hypothetical protein
MISSYHIVGKSYYFNIIEEYSVDDQSKIHSKESTVGITLAVLAISP